MNTKIEMVDEKNLNEDTIEEAAKIIREGGLVAFPTETVYGLGANALDPGAVKKIFQAKGRPQDNPLIVHIWDIKQIETLAHDVPDIAYKFMERFWPGPMTVILPKSSIIPDITSASLPSVGIRMPSNVIARELIKKSGVPIAAPSANISGRPSPTDVERCIEDLDGKVDFILGGEMCQVGVESTVIDCTVTPTCVLRPGGITLEMLREIDGEVYIDPAVMKKPDKNIKPKAPGMKYRHYAPKAPVKIVCGDLKKTIEKINEMVQNYIDENKLVGIIATDETKNFYNKGLVMSLGSRNNMPSISKNLFETLRSFDDKNVDIILSEAFEEKGIGVAIMNRLSKSAGFDITRV
ncbi:L-threonylcarbamoyladenylate synthase [Clostridium luticellarii]|jgi:L-threonylcarbamoyladenylate synthase|uniref:Threonylcarbamoyl-AMP synthase n=1 Tax=Clostridium luticellarii TaxID=1691940 RepID=A0A2T0BQQ5_9CLOT|nr:L-threonylcarbamoyladenylate synthase [Clostridium luticellarii]MCI1945298.1 threonylcarbamoyl-AMP synthase [Clostridium luticellarii]MCI1968641.1 threonylcarbamoyl-AMP synthase [Clostridium luticellarii]MCI1995821.1 threonylcarbamoyl-AMP synthase [Clostridium luticellarii]MCI2040115.1 threonylcarbamoyl-AMP synthase [Clostridium luticellarii]PRR86213.1 Threonylcarbamoyl-AMP synthase [Clostridium luticellarii]